MNASKALQILGLQSAATQEQIRQAYLDLVRVWHPDRFQSDARLREIAEEHLREVNNAYAFLKKGSASANDGRPPRPPAAEAEREPESEPGSHTASAAESQAAWTAASWSSSRYRPFRARLSWRTAVHAAVIATFGLVMLFALVRALDLLRAPVLATDALLARNLRAAAIPPAPRIDPLRELRQAAHSVTDWARGEGAPPLQPAPPANVPEPPSAQVPAGRARTAQAPRSGATRASDDAAPANGTDLIPPADASGAGELRLTNNTDLEAILRVVKGRALSRAIYLTPHGTATVHSISIGVYDVHVELGTDLDAGRFRFRKNRFQPKPLGRFEFREITSDKGIAGSHFEVAVNPR